MTDWQMLLLCAAALVGVHIYEKATMTRLTGFFILQGRRIYQKPCFESYCRLQRERRRMKGKSLEQKFLRLARLLLEQLEELYPRLETGRPYVTVTHLYQVFRKGERKGQIKIHTITKTRTRLLREAACFLGWVDFLRIYFSGERKRLFKQFYRIEFERME